MHYLKICFFTLNLLFLSFVVNANSAILSPKLGGTLIVTYQTDEEAHRLDRIRFWLINEREEKTLYPKKDEFVSNYHTPNERTVVITHLQAGHYQIEFLLPNTDSSFEEALPRHIDLAEGSVVKFEQTIRLRHPSIKEIFVEIPSGLAIIGDPFFDDPQNERSAATFNLPLFAIGVYTVTNAQYAKWLTDALLNHHAFLGDPNQPGLILDSEGKPLCKTMDADSSSQIKVLKKGDIFIASSLPGKENFPMIHVTWYGAKAYCNDLNFRLPSEDEWEKAAGMSISKENDKPRRYKYGFGQNTIDRTWANYKHTDRDLKPQQVLTTPVGFYNGVNFLSLNNPDKDFSSQQTHDARSPAGAYDMSGNVWEWVDNEEIHKDKDKKDLANKIVKGGCFDSLAEGVRVGERLALPPDYSDRFTGFRSARSL